MGDPTAPVHGPDHGEVVAAGDVRIDTHLCGPDDGEVLLLVSGLSRQRIEWPEALILAAHAAGLRTLTVDNRDVGRSSQFDRSAGDGPPYLLADMAGDHLAVLDHYGLDRVHVLGVSMGGMIAQELAIGAPQRLRSLTSVMSTTGAGGVGTASKAARTVLTEPAATDRQGHIEQTVRSSQVIGSPGLVDDEATRRRAAAQYDRGAYPQGVMRQLQAIMASGDRTPALAEVQVPTLVLHGDKDPLVGLSGGEATAAAVPGAHLHVITGMGHDLPLALLPEASGAVIGHILRAR